MRGGEEFSIDDFSLKLEDLLTSTGQLADQNDLQVRRMVTVAYISMRFSCPPFSSVGFISQRVLSIIL